MSIIRNKLESKQAIVAGTSAGMTIQQGAGMINGGESYEALKYGAYDSHQSDLNLLVYVPAGGFNFFKHGLLDTHFGARGRQGRLIRLLHHLHASFAFACDEDTAIVIEDDHFTVLGTNGVTVFDMRRSKSVNDFEIKNVLVTYLTEGDSYVFESNKAIVADWKTSLTGREEHTRPLSPSHDIFSSFRNTNRRNPMEFVRISTDLYNSKADETVAYTYESSPTFSVRMRKLGEGYQGERRGKSYISYKNLNVDIISEN